MTKISSFFEKIIKFPFVSSDSKNANSNDEMETICALYKFFPLQKNDLYKLRAKLLSFMKREKIYGTLLIAKEGINGTISGKDKSIKKILSFIRNIVKKNNRKAKIDADEELEVKFSYYKGKSFNHAKVKVKKEIVTFGVDNVNPLKMVGEYVSPFAWNDLITQDDCLVIDTRNDYEYKIGHFKNAINPNTKNFRQFADWYFENKKLIANKKLAMYCTGGIRCEKATSFLLLHGEKEIYHLKGGILAYLEQTPKSQSLWHGECFVFDNRVSVDHDLKAGKYSMCYACKNALDEEDRESVYYKEGISCPHCYFITPEEKKKSFQERQHQIKLAKEKGESHLKNAH